MGFKYRPGGKIVPEKLITDFGGNDTPENVVSFQKLQLHFMKKDRLFEARPWFIY